MMVCSTNHLERVGTWIAVGYAAGAISKAKALLGRDIDDTRRRAAFRSDVQPA